MASALNPMAASARVESEAGGTLSRLRRLDWSFKDIRGIS
jgi:hypothetical protein